MKVSVLTLGCKVNQYESQAMLEMLQQSGYQPAENGEKADVYVINSCTVTAMSDHKARQLLRRLRRDNPTAVLVLTGCMPQAFPQSAGNWPEADIVLGNQSRASLLPYLADYIANGQRIVAITPHPVQQGQEPYEPLLVHNFHERTRAFIKIEDGCNRFCSYCIIPYARGRVRSRAPEEIIQEAQQLTQAGYREVVLTGINLSAYGQDIGLDLCDAVHAVSQAAGIQRVRLGSLEPEQMDEPALLRLAKEEKLCPQFHLSLQSGCDATLRRMNRHYNSAEYAAIAANIRRIFPGASLTTDVMVGFPGETQEEFNQSLAFVQQIGFAKVHVFAYSRRPGTKAGGMPNQVTNAVKEERSRQMIQTTQQSRENFLFSQVGTTQPVLLESTGGDGYMEGYTPNYTPVQVQLCPSPGLQGEILPVKLTGVQGDFCIGTPVSPSSSLV